ncbi:MAG: PEP/pyruvate-binding domain-containing protein [Desulfovibrio sp.]
MAIRNLFRFGGGRGKERRLEELRREYRARCRSFRLLVKANHEALAALANLEELLRGRRPYGMPQIRAYSVRCLAAGYQMVKQLDRMAPKVHAGLFDALRTIQAAVEEGLARRPVAESGANVLLLESLDRSHAPETGDKMARLGEARRSLGLHIPVGFAVTASACRRFLASNGLQDEIDRLIQMESTEEMAGLYALSSSIRTLILAAEIPAGLRRDAEAALVRMQSLHAEPLRLAVRSSALGEDAPGASFAGQYHSELNVAPENFFDAYKTVVASKYGASAMAYRLNRGIRDSDVEMCVGCMEMVPAVAGGVLYTRDPLNELSDAVHIAAMPGLPKSIVDGSADCDRFEISRKGRKLIRREIAAKSRKSVCDPEEGTLLVDIPETEQRLPAVSDEMAVALAGIGLLLEQVFGAPQDVEWALREDRGIVLLQCRDLHFPTADGVGDEEIEEPEHFVTSPAATERKQALPPPLLSGGVTASAGAATGRAMAVRSDADALRFSSGFVLVTANALPRWAPLLSKASAVVTEHGAVAGHLASVAREYGVPALFSLPGALRELRQAGEITVDADHRAVYPGRVPTLLHRSATRNLIQGSAVHRSLVQVLDRLAPLHLTDPQSLHFTPAHCRTLHDVIRYCHELGVREMFGREPGSGLDKGLSRRLVAGVPLQYWVVDLEDGLVPQSEAQGGGNDGTVDITEVRSEPMLALWDGMRAVEWRGPPAVNAGGLMAVMARSAMDPGLAEGAASPYAVRNYFLVSREYCSLQARFGFHFCTVEGLLGEDAQENYVIFQFKGGAADLNRRVRRASMVGEILEERGFIVEIKEDSLYARIEGADRATLSRLLRVVGYLVVHTRQLDMIMGDPDEAARAGAEMRRDLAGIAARAAGVPLPSPRPNGR